MSPRRRLRQLAAGLHSLLARLLPWLAAAVASAPPDRTLRAKPPSSDFEAAAATLQSVKRRLPVATQLQLYALYKQSTQGDAPSDAPSSLHVTASAKWTAWDALRGCEAARARQQYVAAVSAVVTSADAAKARARARALSGVDDGLGGLGDDSDDGLAGLGDPQDAIADAVGSIGGPGAVSCLAGNQEEEEEAPAAEGSGAALHAAARAGNLAACESLLSQGVAPDAADVEGHTALHWAADAGRGEVALALLERGADPSARNCDGSTPLHMACAASHTEVALLLCRRGADCTAADLDGDTPLGFADASLAAELARQGYGPGE